MTQGTGCSQWCSVYFESRADLINSFSVAPVINHRRVSGYFFLQLCRVEVRPDPHWVKIEDWQACVPFRRLEERIHFLVFSAFRGHPHHSLAHSPSSTFKANSTASL